MFLKGMHPISLLSYICFGVVSQAKIIAWPVNFIQFKSPFIDKQTGGS